MDSGVHSLCVTHHTVVLTSVVGADGGGQAWEWEGVIWEGVSWYFLGLGIQEQSGQILHHQAESQKQFSSF